MGFDETMYPWCVGLYLGYMLPMGFRREVYILIPQIVNDLCVVAYKFRLKSCCIARKLLFGVHRVVLTNSDLFFT